MRTSANAWMRCRGLAAWWLALSAVGAVSWTGGSVFSAWAEEGASCLECHPEGASSLSGGPHAMVEDGFVTCLSCHRGDPAAHADDPGSHRLIDPAELAQKDLFDLCLECHAGDHPNNQASLHGHPEADVLCLDCHQVHGGVDPGSLQEAEPSLCLECHPAQRADFAQSYRHPVPEGIVRCSDCHLITDDRRDAGEPGACDDACLRCHREFQGPFPFEHQAAVGYSSEEGGCLTCHLAHGSPLPLLLRQPYGGSEAQLCAQCHAVPGHRSNLQHGTEFAEVACAECHADIHGSYTSRLLLSPAVAAQGCLAVGCHQQ